MKQNKQKNINKISSHDRQKKFAKGFTLLELLVVVLIIGILAGIALPQYQLAVDKAEFSKYQSMVTSLKSAYNDYVMTHGEGTRHFEDLSVTLPNGFENYNNSGTTVFDCVADNNMWCCIRDYKYMGETSNWQASISCGKKDNDISVLYMTFLFDPKGKTYSQRGVCFAQATNKRANRLCSSMGEYQKSTNVWTPEGNLFYKEYSLK